MPGRRRSGPRRPAAPRGSPPARGLLRARRGDSRSAAPGVKAGHRHTRPVSIVYLEEALFERQGQDGPLMTLTRPRLVLLPGDVPADAGLIESLQGDYEVVRIPDAGALKRMIEQDPGAIVLCTAQMLRQVAQSTWP